MNCVRATEMQERDGLRPCQVRVCKATRSNGKTTSFVGAHANAGHRARQRAV